MFDEFLVLCFCQGFVGFEGRCYCCVSFFKSFDVDCCEIVLIVFIDLREILVNSF